MAGTSPAMTAGLFAEGSDAGLALQLNAGRRQHGREFARLEHLARDVAPAYEFPLDVKLGNRWPIGVFLDALTNVGILEHVHADYGRAEIIEDLDDLAGKPALRKLGRPFHEQDNRIIRNDLLDAFASVSHG